jgi:pyrroloquinoline-quinone synthase
MNFSQEFKAKLLEYDLLNHHFYKLWSAGKLTLDVLKEYSLQYYQQVKNFPRYLSATHSICENFAFRKILLENLCDEENDDAENGIVNHIQLWKNFCLGLGLSEAETENVKIMPSTQRLIDSFFELSRESVESGVAVLYSQEHQYAKISESKRDGLCKFYNIDDKDTVKFFSVHEKADIWHAEQLETLLDNMPSDSHSKIMEAGVKAIRALNGFLDGMVERFKLNEIKCDCEEAIA